MVVGAGGRVGSAGVLDDVTGREKLAGQVGVRVWGVLCGGDLGRGAERCSGTWAYWLREPWRRQSKCGGCEDVPDDEPV